MKKILVSLTAVSICLTACGKEGDFKKAINDKISKRYACVGVNGYVSNADIYNLTPEDRAKMENKTKDSYVISWRYDKNGKLGLFQDYKDRVKQYEALASIGFLTKITESYPLLSWDKKPDGYYKYDIYTPTETAKPIISKQNSFCYAHQEVASIDNFAEGDQGSYHTAIVKYTYKFVDINDWINKPGIKETFPDITKTLDDPDKSDSMTLVKTNNGWSADL